MAIKINQIQSTDGDTEDTTTDLSVGEILRRARVASKKSLEDVERSIRIRASILQDIEDMKFDNMPGWIYTVGFVRSYSNYLDLDGEKMTALLKSQTSVVKKQSLHFPSPVHESALPDRWVIISAIGVLFVIAVTAWSLNSTLSPSSEIDVNAIPPLEVAENISEEIIPDILGPFRPEDNIASAPQDENGVLLPQQRPNSESSEEEEDEEFYRVVVRVKEESWIEVRDAEGRTQISRILQPGEEYFVPEDAGNYTMSVGNIVGIEILVDGDPIIISGTPGEVRRNIPLDPESLKEMFP